MLFTESFGYLLETGFQNWMTESLTQMKISDVHAEYKPTREREPIIWQEDSRLLIIHEPDSFQAALYFLEWIATELPRQWKQVWEKLQNIEKNHGREAAETVLSAYISEMDKREMRPSWKTLR